jgi:hypothetical protein
MRTTDAARLKKLLTGALGKRLAQADAAQCTMPRPSRNRDSQRAVAKLLGTELANLGPIRKAFTAILEKDVAATAKFAKQAQAAALKNARTARKTLASATAQRLKVIRGLISQDGQSSERFLLGKPFLIWPTPGLEMDDAQYIQNNSFAKVQVSTSGSRYDALRFYYLWDNPRNAYSVIDIDGFIIFNGLIKVGAGGGVFPGDRWSRVTIDGVLEVYEWWTQPPTSIYPQPDQVVEAANPHFESEGWSETGGILPFPVFRGYDLRCSQFVVPPLATAVLAVTAKINSTNGSDSSNSVVDFSSGSFQIGSPFVTINLVS